MYFAPLNSVGFASDGGGEHIDPRQTDVLATTDELPAGRWIARVTIVAHSLDDSKALFEIQHRDSTDDENNPLESLVVCVPVDDSKQFDVAFDLNAGERISVVPYDDLIGTVMVGINYQQGL